MTPSMWLTRLCVVNLVASVSCASGRRRAYSMALGEAVASAPRPTVGPQNTNLASFVIASADVNVGNFTRRASRSRQSARLRAESLEKS